MNVPPPLIRPEHCEQTFEQVVEVSSWHRDEVAYPEGRRTKRRIFCPLAGLSPIIPPIQRFLIPGHPYLFKMSHERVGAEEQFYCEVIAFIVAEHIGVEVPPAFVAFDSESNQCGALIQWFYPEVEGRYMVRYVPGEDFALRIIKDFDPARGKKHNAQLMFCLCRMFEASKFIQSSGLFLHWFKTFVFDALIGNTDRHAQNWGVLFYQGDQKDIVRFSPAFDNGTSLGFEQPSQNFSHFNDVTFLDRYIRRGTHHVKWMPRDEKRCGHAVLLQKICEKYPEAKSVFNACLNFDFDSLAEKVQRLTLFNIPVPLSERRCDFILKLLRKRQLYLQQEVA